MEIFYKRQSIRFKRTTIIYRMKLFSLFLLLFLSSCVKSHPMDSVKHELPAETAKLASEMEDQGKEHIHMPPLPAGYSADRYINIKPCELTSLTKGKVVLLDIWDYTCVNCIRTLPYIKS